MLEKRQRRWLITGWLVWLGLILAVYYRQLWRLLAFGPGAWQQNYYSLFVFGTALRRLAGGGFPAAYEAGGRLVTAVVGFLLVLGAAQVVGFWLLRWFDVNWQDRFLYQTALGLGGLSYLSLALAGLGLYTARNVAWLIGGILLLGAGWLIGKRPLPRLPTNQLTRQQILAWFKQNRAFKAITILALAAALIGALAPEVEYDALWYHLWLPQQWLLAGHPVDIVSEYVSLYPLTWELLYGASFAVGNVITAKLINFLPLPLTGWLVYRLARRILPDANPWLAVALFVTTPTVLWEATTTYIDLALALYIGLTLYAGLMYLKTEKSGWLVLAILSMGLALAIKHLALIVLFLAVIGLALGRWQATRDWRGVLKIVILFAGLSLTIPLPWYCRSWLSSGNPVFPDMYALFGAFPADRWSAITERGLQHFKAGFGRSRTWGYLLLLPWDMTVHAEKYQGSFGPLSLILLPPLFLAMAKSAVRWLLAFVLLYLLFWASPISSFQMRFLLPLAPILAVLAAAGGSRLVDNSPDARWQAVLVMGLAGLLVLNLPPFISLHEASRQEWSGWLTHVAHEIPLAVVLGQESEADYLSRRVPAYAAWQFINANLPPDARVLTFSGGDHFYSDVDRLSDDATIVHTAVWGAAAGQESQALARLDELGVTHILFNKQRLESGEMDDLALTQPSMMARLTPVYADRQFVLYAINW